MSSFAKAPRRSSLLYSLKVVPVGRDAYSVPIADESVSIGRSQDSGIVIDEPSVSRRHCLIIPSLGRLTMLDQDSSNGTLLNGQSIRQAKLKHADVIQIGNVQIRVRVERVDVEAETAPGDPLTSPPECGFALLPEEQIVLLRKLCARMACVDTAVGAADTLLDVVLKVFPATRACVIAIDRSRIPPVGEIISDRGGDAWRNNSSTPSYSVVHSVLKSGRVEYHQSILQGASRPARPGAPFELKTSRIGASEVLAAPIRLGALGSGVLYLETKRFPAWATSKEMLELLGSLANLAAPSMCRGLDHDRRQESQSQPLSKRESHQQATPDQRVVELLDGILKQNIPLQSDGKGNGGGALSKRRQLETEVDETSRIEFATQLEELKHLRHRTEQMTHGMVRDIRTTIEALDANLMRAAKVLAAAGLDLGPVESSSSCSRQILSLTQHMLDVRRMEEGSLELENHELDLRDLIRSAIKRLDGQTLLQRVQLADDTEESQISVVADSGVLVRVIDNLLENAILHAGKGGWVRISARPVLNTVRLFVEDSGPVVPMGIRDRIFDEWYEPSGSDQRKRGIGLYFCRLAVEAHGGSIYLDGNQGRNRFVITLPGAADEREPNTCITSAEPEILPTPTHDSWLDIPQGGGAAAIANSVKTRPTRPGGTAARKRL